MYSETQIREMADNIVRKEKAELDIWKVPVDLAALFNDISEALAQKEPGKDNMMVEYQSLMETERDLYDPFVFYQNGLAFDGKEIFPALMQCLASYHEDPKVKEAFFRRDKLFQEIIDCLEDDERRLLMNDYNEIYRQYHCILARKIGEFFELGAREKRSELLS